jgi:hypothetical protein
VIRYLFDSPRAAAAGLEAVLLRARKSQDNFVFGGLNVRQLMDAGLWIEGDTDEVQKILDDLPGAVRQEALGR